MAQRLKKKLDNMGVDPSNSKLTENFCLIGTPLPSLASSKDANEFVPVWKQEVRDEQGRRRLHGAFTGGFSAGYFNTVGSKEGWTPSTFKSSRTNRASQKTARPEDFMDDEDLAEFRDSQKLVDTTELPSLPGPSDSNDIASALQSLTLPSSDSPGAKLLRKMGWKPGQGIGPRVSYARRRQQDVDAGVVKAGVPEDPEAGKHLFAPRDTPVLLFRPKENAHGLGHVGPVRLGGEVAGGREREGPNISAGFGLGAVNDADDDDIDVYDPGATSRSTRMAYDEVDDTDADGHSRRRPLTLSNQPQTRSSTTSHTGGRFAEPSGKFNDGRPVLAGFALSEAPVGQDEWFPLPEVPTGWAPDPRRVWEKFSGEKGKEGNEAEKANETQAQDGKGGWKKAPTAQEASLPSCKPLHHLNIIHYVQRGTQLGEPTLPQPKKSVFDYLSQKDRDRLQNFRNAPNDTTPAPPKPAVKPRIAPTTAPTAKAALLGFQPFTSDPLRQARYTAYLQHFASPVSTSDPPGLGLLPDQNAEQFNREMEDYAKAAAIFKPVSGAMAGRFVGASATTMVVGAGPTIGEGGLYQPTFDKDQDSTQSTATIPIEEQDPKKNAARHGMYGPLTHDVQPWYPHRLLCKRFGVRDPHPDGPPTAAAKTWEEQVGVAPTAPPASVDLADVEMRPLDAEGGQEGADEEDFGPRDLSNVGLGEDPHQGVDTLTYVRPAMDIFKAIFASDEEDSEDEDQVGKAKTEDTPISALDAALRPANNGPEGPVDLTTFRPVFNVRTKAKTKDKGERREKKKDKNKRAVLSFDVDEGADNESETIAAKSKSKRRERDKGADRVSKKARTEDDEEGDWVEKPPPPSVSGTGGPAPVGGTTNPEAGGGLPSAEGGSTRTRKRAIDFM